MAVITISRQVAALGDEVAGELAKRLGYKFITRKEIEKRIVELGFPENKMPKFDERKPGFFASLTKDRDEYLNYAQYAILEAAEQKNVVIRTYDRPNLKLGDEIYYTIDPKKIHLFDIGPNEEAILKRGK